MKKIKKIIEIFKISFKLSKKNFFVVLLSALLQTAKKIIVLLFPALIVNSLINSTSYNNSFHIILVFCILTVAADMLYKSLMLLSTAYGYSLSNKAALTVGQKGTKIEYSNWENKDSIEKIYNAVSGTWIFSGIIDVLIEDFLSSILLFASICYIFSEINILLIIPIILISIVNILLNRYKSKFQHKYSKIKDNLEKKKKYNYLLNTDYKYGKEVRIYNADKLFNKKFMHSCKEFRETSNKEQKGLFIFNVISSFIYFLECIFAYLFSIYRYSIGKFNVGYFLTFSASIVQLTTSIKNIITVFTDLNEMIDYYNDYLEFMKIDEITTQGNKQVNTENQFQIEFKNVSFKYPNTENYVLKNISFKINTNESVAMVGENGSGKSTIVKLMLRLYKVTSGEILLNNININEIDYKQYMSLFSSVFQDFKLHSYSLKENIAFNNEDEEKMWDLMKYFEIEDVINQLPLKLETYVTKLLSKEGRDFSQGEKQKIAICRSFYKDYSMMILDEPTSAFDPISEMKFYKSLNDKTINRNCLYVTHRMASAKFTDKIIVLNEGDIIEMGSFKELMSNKGTFYDMFSLQSDYLKEI